MAYSNKMSLSVLKNNDGENRKTISNCPIKKSEILGYESSALPSYSNGVLERNSNLELSMQPANSSTQSTPSSTFWKIYDDEYKSDSVSRMFDSNNPSYKGSIVVNPAAASETKAQSEKLGSSGQKMSRASMNPSSRPQTSRSFYANPLTIHHRTNSSLCVLTKVARREHWRGNFRNSNASRTNSKTESDDTSDQLWFPNLKGKQVVFQLQRLRADDNQQSANQFVKDSDAHQLELLSDTIAIWSEFIEHGITSLAFENQLLEQIVETLEQRREEKENEMEDLVDHYLLHTRQLQVQEVSLTIARENLSEAFNLARQHDFKAVFLDEHIKFCAWTIDSGVRIRSHQNTVLLVKLSETEVQCSMPKHNSYKHLVFITKQYSAENLPKEFFFWSEALRYAVRDDLTLKQSLRLHALSINTNSGYLELNVEPMHLYTVCLSKMATSEQNPDVTRSLFLPFDSKDLSFKVLKVNKLHGNSNRTININAKNATIKIIKKNTNPRIISSQDITGFKWECDGWRGKFTLNYFWKRTEKTLIGICDEGHVRRLHFCLQQYVLCDHQSMGLLTRCCQDFDFPMNYGDSNPQIQQLLKKLQKNKWMCFCCRVLHQVMVDQLIEDGCVEHEMIMSFKMLSTRTRFKIEKVVHTVISLMHWVALTLIPIRSSEGYQRKGGQRRFWTDLSLECLGMTPHLSAMLPMLAEALHRVWRKRALRRKGASSTLRYQKWMRNFHDLDQDGMRYFGTLAVSTLKALLVGHRVKAIEHKMNVEP